MNLSTSRVVPNPLPGHWPVVVIAILSWLSIITCLDPAGSYPDLPEGPGLTVDEIFNVEQGVYLVEQARSLGWINLVPGTSQEAYRSDNGLYNPDHPPLGRWWLGVHHHLTRWLVPPLDPEGLCVTACARTGSATAFALTVLLVGWVATGWSGRAAGVMTAISLVLMPRLFGHAHLASLETITNLSCTAAVLAVAAWWNGPVPPTRRAAMFAGVLLGLALLTKIQAVLIPVPVIGWALWRWRTSAIIPLILWGTTGLFVLFGMWPYLWFDPLGHGLEYLGRATNRATIQVWYFGEKYADKEVPWHYPFVMFGLTVPVILHGLGLLGLFESWPPGPVGNLTASGGDHSPFTSNSRHRNSDRIATIEECRNRDGLLLACTLFPLIVFATPGVAVYDGERLFLTSFPLWAFFVGRGWLTFLRLLSRCMNSRPCAIVACAALLLLTARSLVAMSPCHLCYYNPLATLISNSDSGRTGLEVDYWGVGVTRGLLSQMVKSVPNGTTIVVLPTLHQFQADDYRRQSPILRAHGVKMADDQPDLMSSKYVIVFRRQADLPEAWNFVKADEMLGSTVCGGRLLAYFIRRNE